MKQQDIDRLVAARDFTDWEVRDYLDSLPWGLLIAAITDKYRHVIVHETPEAPRSAYSDDDPAVMQAIGRCAANRSRGRLVDGAFLGRFHPDPCGWCDVPVEELLAACEWDKARSEMVMAEMYVWTGKRGRYDREGASAGTFHNPTHRDFWHQSDDPAVAAQERAERKARIEGVIVASRA